MSNTCGIAWTEALGEVVRAQQARGRDRCWRNKAEGGGRDADHPTNANAGEIAPVAERVDGFAAKTFVRATFLSC